MKYIAIAAVFVAITAVVWTARKHQKIIAPLVPPLFVLGLLIALMVGCSPSEPTGSILNIPVDLQTPSVIEETLSPTPSVEPSETPTPNIDFVPSSLPEQSSDDYDTEPESTYPTPQIVEVPVEV